MLGCEGLIRHGEILLKNICFFISFKSAFFFLHVGDIKETKFKGKTKH